MTTKLEKERKLSFWNFLGVMKWLFSFNYRISPWATVSQVITRILLDLSPLFNAFILARLLDKIFKIITVQGSTIYEIVPLLIVLFIFNIINSALNGFYNYIFTVIQTNLNAESQLILARHINSLGVQTLEKPEIVNKIERVRFVIGSLMGDLERATMFIGKAVVLISASLIIFKILPTIALVMCIAVIPQLISNRIHMKRDWHIWRSETENMRRANNAVATISDTVKLQEITITSSFRMLSDVYINFRYRYIKSIINNAKSWQIWNIVFGSLTDIVGFFGYFLIFKNFFYKLISIGDISFQMRALDMFTNNILNVSGNFSSLYERAIKISEVKDLFEMQPMIKDGNIILTNDSIAPRIKFENVDFKYPNSSNYVIKNLSLGIPAGQKIAIVGENGAGKTTLVKLLTRFYKVNTGKIFIDDHNINNIDIDSWYKKIGVLFQDYNTYPFLTVKENIVIGRPDDKIDDQKITLSAEQANISSFVNNYKNGFDQVLSEKYKGGTRPSTGQWQKIAIARFFYRNSPVVVFDEPTASIDAVSEAEIFGKIYEFFTGKTVIIISHRFSTVRNADKIYVLDKGEIVESGNHDELMELKGKYFKAFNIQAEGYSQ